jgi:2'-5' RNA ligase
MVLAIVSPLPESARAHVERLWTDLLDRFDIGHAGRVPPHVSYHGAAEYGSALYDRLSQLVERFDPFPACSAGIGIFTGESPVVHSPIVRSDDLSELHASVFEAVLPESTEPNPFYAPSEWQPHVTLAHGDLVPDDLGDVVSFLNARKPELRFPIRELAVVDTDESGDRVLARFPFD